MSLIYISKDQSNNSNTLIHKKPNGIYIGGKSEAKNKSKLLSWGITHILNVTPDKEVAIESGVPNYFESSSSFIYKRVAVYDSSTTDLCTDADSIVTFIHNGLYHGSVFVHCQKGKSRSATCVGFYLMRKCLMSLSKALKVMKERRSVIDPIPAFLVQLKNYELKCTDLGLELINNDEDDKNVKQAKKGNSSSLKRIVGPSLPPNFVTKKPKTTTLIGPTMPPNTHQDANVINTTDTTTKASTNETLKKSE